MAAGIRLTTEEFIARAKAIHGLDKYDYSLIEYINNGTTVKIGCKKHGIFLQAAGRHMRGAGCWACYCDRASSLQVRSLEDTITAFKKVHGPDKYDYSLIKPEEYKHSKSMLAIKCVACGNILRQSANSHLRGRGGCKHCAYAARAEECTMTQEQFIARCKEVHGPDRFDYSQIKFVKIFDKKKLKIKCNVCQTWFEQRASYHIYGNSCTTCFNMRRGKARARSQASVLAKCIEKHGTEKYDYSLLVYVNNHTKVKIICNSCNKLFEQTINSHVTGHGCPHCARKKRLTDQALISKLEMAVLDYLSIPTLKRQENIGRYYVDGFDPATNTVHEVLGTIWHSDPRYCNMEDKNPIIKVKYKTLYDYTFKRFQKIKDMGYNIKYVWEADWDDFKKGKVKELVINTY